MEPIMMNVNDIITIGGYESTFYSEKKLQDIFSKIKNKLQNDIRQIFEEDLAATVQGVKDILEDNNMLLKGLNIGEDRSEEKMPEFNQGKGNFLNSPQNGGRNNPLSNKNSYNSHSMKNPRSEKESPHPYGLGIPHRGNDIPER